MGDFVVKRWDLQPHPGDQAPVHIHHGSDEAFCVVTGQLEVLVGDQRRILNPGDLAVVPAGTAHTFATVGDAIAEIVVVMTPQIEALIAALHDAADEDRAAVWSRFNSEVV